MKAKALLEALKQLSEDELNLVVYGYCDHGQQPDEAQLPTLIYYEDEPSDGYSMDKEEAEEYGYTKRAILL